MVYFFKNVHIPILKPILEALINSQLSTGHPKQPLCHSERIEESPRCFVPQHDKKGSQLSTCYPEQPHCHSERSEESPRCFVPQHDKKGSQLSTLNYQLSTINSQLSTLNSQLALGYMTYAPEIRAGFLPNELDILKNYGLPMYNTPQDFHPDVTIIADSVYPWVQDCGKLIHVGHGVLSKGQYYTDTETARREEYADIICVPGEYHKIAMEKIVSKPVIATGMAKLDKLFSGQITRDTELTRLNLPKDAFYVLFAPTFNDELSAIPFTKEKIVEVLPNSDSILLIKLHGSTAQHYKDMYRDLHIIDERVVYIEDLDITPYLAIADVMISDVSSAMMEFAALEKPLVLFNNPNTGLYKNYNSKDLEYTHRNIGYQVINLEEMKLAVLKIHRGSDPFVESRKEITDSLFANKYDGEATRRIVEIVTKL